jgi:hypothetical protein
MWKTLLVCNLLVGNLVFWLVMIRKLFAFDAVDFLRRAYSQDSSPGSPSSARINGALVIVTFLGLSGYLTLRNGTFPDLGGWLVPFSLVAGLYGLTQLPAIRSVSNGGKN